MVNVQFLSCSKCGQKSNILLKEGEDLEQVICYNCMLGDQEKSQSFKVKTFKPDVTNRLDRIEKLLILLLEKVK